MMTREEVAEIINYCQTNQITYSKVGFDAINDEVFRHLVISRLSCPSSKAATVEYLKNYYNEDINLSRIHHQSE